MQKRGFFKRTDILIIAAFLIAGLAGILIFSLTGRGSGQTYAVVTVDGEEALRVNLSEERQPYTLSLYDEGVPVKFEVKDHKIRFIEVQCPDKICENTGFIGSDMQTAVCMPNKTVLTVHTEE
ncbi:NusG domain II-containing protein [Candidatus Soleaferrea massiliensis]|uniref:NusG domain II-containing protein n=1 Tax=Candidatus Soleaferrea massiliensis TaxID=1470354 RepID=UPI000590819C|nr:NusG domain II-containing protein [Candidatus Soleaferrea massiliensis]